MTAVASRLAAPLVVLVAVGAWQLWADVGGAPEHFSSPSRIAAALGEEVSSGLLLENVRLSAARILVGFVIGAGLGALTGFVSGSVHKVAEYAEPTFSALYPLPKIVLFPVMVLFFGFSETSRIVLIAIVCFFPAYLNAASGARAVVEAHLWVARNAGATRRRQFFFVVVPAALPRTVGGLRVSLAVSFTMLFGVESLAITAGVGGNVTQSFQAGLYDHMFAAIATLALMGLVADLLLMAVTGRFLRGQNRELWSAA